MPQNVNSKSYRNKRSTNRLASILGFIACLSACSGNPIKQTQKHCPDCTAITLDGGGPAPLRAYLRNQENAGDTLHIYLEGDGKPWRKNGTPNTNPNTNSYTALKLMALDSAPSLYLNRPCYGFENPPEHCMATDWTSGRYSEQNISELATAIEQFQSENAHNNLVLIGHSGGGSVATILASRLRHVKALITIAANLDHLKWTQAFNYLPLSSSLNAVDYFPLKKSIKRWHFAGDNDQIVPWELTYNAINNDLGAKFILKKGFGHNCCWGRIWNEVLSDLE